jgi:uncharacterized protein (TIGR01777 family)
MHVLITGGTGLIGRALTSALLADGHQVTIISRSAQRPAGIPEPVGILSWEQAREQGWDAMLRGVDAVVNLAGENLAGAGLLPERWTPQKKERILRSRVEVGERLTQAIASSSHKPSVFVQASASGYYGPRGDEEITEEHAPGNDFLAGVAKAWEASTAGVESQGVRRVIIRTGVVLSTRGGALPRLALTVRLGLGGRIGSGRQWMPWIHIEDEVRAIQFLIAQPQAQGPYNLCAPQPLRNAELMRALGKVLRRPIWLPIPAFAMKLLLGEMSTVLLDGQRMVPSRLLEAGFVFQHPEIHAALRDLFSRGM